jgi:hypothetical protein
MVPNGGIGDAAALEGAEATGRGPATASVKANKRIMDMMRRIIGVLLAKRLYIKSSLRGGALLREDEAIP